MRLNLATAGWLVAFGVPLAVTWPGQAGIVVPLDQQRSTDTFVNAAQCGGDFVGHGESAEGFAPFSSLVQSQHDCDSGLAHALASQESTIGNTALNAVGVAVSEAAGPVSNVVHAIADSLFEVTFQLDSAAQFTLNGELNASGALPVVGSLARVRLVGPGDVPIVLQAVEPGPAGQARRQTLQEEGLLEAGQYSLRGEAVTVVDSKVPPHGIGEASFEFSFEISSGSACPGNIAEDTIVNIYDLEAVILAWGTADFAADVNGDGLVNVLDLIVVILHWGPCP